VTGLAVAAVALPLAGLGAAVLGVTSRGAVVAAGRWGALGAVAAWAVVLVGGGEPAIGRFTPDALAAAAAAGAALLAAALATDRDDDDPVPLVAPPLAAALALAAGVAAEPSTLTRGPAIALVVAGAAGSVAALVLPGWARVTLVALPVAVLAAVRGAAVLDDPPAALPLALAAAAAATGVLHATRTRRFGHTRPAVVLALGAAAVAVAPVEAARAGAVLLGAAAVAVAALASQRWALAATLPGAAVVAAALADVPVPGGPSPVVHVAFAVLLGAAAVSVAVAAPGDAARPPAEVAAAVAAVTAWVVLAPGSWGWALPDDGALDAWDRAAGVGAAAVALAAVGDRLARRARQ
jgi:hypothetical protein